MHWLKGVCNGVWQMWMHASCNHYCFGRLNFGRNGKSCNCIWINNILHMVGGHVNSQMLFIFLLSWFANAECFFLLFWFKWFGSEWFFWPCLQWVNGLYVLGAAEFVYWMYVWAVNYSVLGICVITNFCRIFEVLKERLK